MDASLLVHVLFGVATFLLLTAALIRTWASAYLNARVVYAGEVTTQSLVADGPYRHARNPLYFANVLLAISLGAMMSRTGFVVALIAMVVFCYRLIFREEAEFKITQGEQYQRYRSAVPRLWPSLLPRIASAGRQAKWIDGFKAESWYWGFAVASVVYAVTMNLKLFFVILAASIVLLKVSSVGLQKKSAS
ncbi:MAG: hypothetical protein NVS9B4_13870 [Candidatus Acidiferrum sp.]